MVATHQALMPHKHLINGCELHLTGYYRCNEIYSCLPQMLRDIVYYCGCTLLYCGVIEMHLYPFF